MGKSKKVTVGYKYYLGEHMVLCHGPIDNISTIKVDGRVVWLGEEDGGQITINAPTIFGGDEREGGISGLVDIDMGGSSQGQNSYLVSKIGSDVPAYRGVVSAVLRQCYLGNNPYLKPWAFRGQRIHKTTDGATQWYDAKAEIGDSVVPVDSVWDYQFTSNSLPPPSIPVDGWSSGEAPFGQDQNFTPPHPINTHWPDDTGLWIKKTVPATGVPLKITGQIENACFVYWDGVLIGSVNPDNSDTNVVLTFEFTVSGGQVSLGNHELALYCLDDFVDYSRDNTYIYVEVTQAAPQKDMNPAHVIRECLTDPDWGMGYLADDIDEDAFRIAADKLYAEELGVSLLWDKQMPLEDFIMEVVKHIDGALYVSRTTGKFVLKLIRDDYDPDTLIELDESNIAKVTNPTRPTFGELANSVTVAYWNAASGKDATITITDTALVQQQGTVIGTTVQYPGFTNARNASLAGQRDLRALSAPFLSCTIYADQTAEPLNIGDVFKFSWSRWRISGMIMRVTGIAYGDGKTNQVRITCAEDVFSTSTTTVVTDPGSGWVDPSQPPSAPAAQFAGEVPYYELVQSLGQTDIDNTLSANVEVGYVMAAASKPTSAINGRIWTNAGSAYEDVGGLDFCPSCTLTSDISYTDTVINVENGTDLDTVEVGTFVQIGSGNDAMEICRVDAVDTVAGTVTLGRGCLDTPPKKHAAGTRLFFWDLYSGFDPTEYVVGEVVNVKITPTTGQGQLALEDATEMTVTLAQRAGRPYPPGDLRFDGISYPTLVPASSTDVTWAHRDRRQQTSGTLEDYTETSIGPEAGTTYDIELYDQGDPTVKGSYTGISGTGPQTVDLSVLGTEFAHVKVWSVRDTIRSLQPAEAEFEYTLATMFVVYPFTYDEDGVDEDGAAAPTLTRQGAGPHVTPLGFEGDGQQSRYNIPNASLPAWMPGVSRRMYGLASVTFNPYRPQSASNGDTIIHLGVDAAGAVPNPRLRLAVLQDTTSPWAQASYLALQTYDTALRTIPIARPFWKYQREFPQLVSGANRIHPQGIAFLDNERIIVNGHREDLESMCWVINTTTMAVEGSFTFGTTTNRHVAAWAINAAGEVWCCDYETERLLKIDIANSLATGVAVILATVNVAALAGAGGVAFITVSGTEYVLVPEFGTSGTRYVYAWAASGLTDGATLTVAGRYKRFVIGTYVQGIAIEGTTLYASASNTQGAIRVYTGFDTTLASTADGASLSAVTTWPACTGATEDLTFHPVTGDCWMTGEGWSAPADFDGFCGIWSSALDGTLYEHHVTFYYDGSGTVGVKVNNRPHTEKTYTPVPDIEVVSIGGPPQASPDFGGGFFNGYLKNVRFQNAPITDDEYTATVTGTYELNTLTAYTVTITNPGAEAGNTSGWTNESGSIGVRTGSPVPHSGSYYFFGGTSATAIARQRFDIATVTGLSTTDIDTAAAAGALWAKARWWQTSFDSNDPAGVGIRTLDGVPTEIAISYSAIDWTAYSDDGATASWYPMKHSKAIEPGARNIDIVQRHNRTSGTNNDGYQDDFELVIYKK